MYSVVDSSDPTPTTVGRENGLRVEATYGKYIHVKGTDNVGDMRELRDRSNPVQPKIGTTTLIPSFASTGVRQKRQRRTTRMQHRRPRSRPRTSDSSDILTYSLATADPGADNTRFSIDKLPRVELKASGTLDFEDACGDTGDDSPRSNCNQRHQLATTIPTMVLARSIATDLRHRGDSDSS